MSESDDESESPILATSAELKAIAQRTFAALGLFDRGSKERRRDPVERFFPDFLPEAEAASLRFIAHAAQRLADPSLLPILVDLHRACHVSDFDTDQAEGNRRAAAAAIRATLAAGAAVTKHVWELARHADAALRTAVAAGLPPAGEDARRILEALVCDPVAEVRTAAKENLGRIQPTYWWQGKFSADPLATLPEADRARLEPALQRLSELLDSRYFHRDEHADEILRLLGELPDRLAVEAAERTLGAGHFYQSLPKQVGALLLQRPGGVDALRRVCQAAPAADHHDHFDVPVKEILQAVPSDRRGTVCLEMLAVAVRAPDSERRQHRSAPVGFAEALVAAWPCEEDPSPILDAALSLPTVEGPAIDWVRWTLAGFFKRADLDFTHVWPRLFQARLEGYPGPWNGLGHHVDPALDRAPIGPLRAAAEQATAGEDRVLLVWGMATLLQCAYDPERDPPRGEFVRRLHQIPKCRDAALESYGLRDWFLPAFREELRAGRLDLKHAGEIMESIDRLWGGLIASFQNEASPENRATKQAEARSKLPDALGPAEIQGPPTPEEWRAYRAARERDAFVDWSAWHTALRVLPEGPWWPEDRALTDRAIQRWRDADEGSSLALAHTLGMKPTLQDLPLFDEFARKGDAEDLEFYARLKDCAERALGIEPPAAADDSEVERATRRKRSPGIPAPKTGDVEWMDQEEDGEDR